MSKIDWIIAAVLALYSLWLLRYTYKVAKFHKQIGKKRWVPMVGAVMVVVAFVLAFTSIPFALMLAIGLLVGGLICYIVGGAIRRTSVHRIEDQAHA